MTRFVAVVLVALSIAAPAPVLSQDSEGDGLDDSFDLFAEGARRLMEEFAGELGPLLLQLEALMDEITAYQAPEILDNGDIIIRRRPDAPVLPPEPDAEDPAIEL